MTQDDIIRMALEAAQGEPMSLRLCNDLTLKAWTPWLEKFAGLIALNHMKETCDTCVVKKCYKRMDAEIEAAVLAEREACAKVAESVVTKQSKHINDGKPFYDHMYWEDIAAAIRARGESELS